MPANASNVLKATKQQNVCALLPLVKNNIEPLMQLLRKELNNEYSLDNNTKCLYTAVMVMALYLGKKSLLEVDKCDVDYVNKYYGEMRASARTRNPGSTFDPSPMLVKQCASSMLSPTKSGRFLYYVMITNADVPKADGATIMFPGHVCVIEKYPSGRYYVYQSYINEYDLEGHFNRNSGTFAISKDALASFFAELVKLYDDGVWTPAMSAQWKRFTHVDASRFEGHTFKGSSFFCFRKIPIKTCALRLKQMIERKGALDTVDKRAQASLSRLRETINSSNFSV